MGDIVNADDALEMLNAIISAAENWSNEYSKDPDTHAKLIKHEGKLNRALRKYFKELSNDRIWKYINWTAYHTERIKAYDVNVIFDEDNFGDDESDFLLGVMHDPLLDGMGIGIDAGQTIYNRDIGMSTADANVMKAARTYSAQLVKGVTKTTQDRIQQSIQTSLMLGEDQTSAASRISDIINDPGRAEMIARTEAVNSYNQGLMQFAGTSGATKKQWQDLGADDICGEYGSQDPIDINDSWDDNDAPPAHPNCRCGMQLIYPTGDSEETDN